MAKIHILFELKCEWIFWILGKIDRCGLARLFLNIKENNLIEISEDDDGSQGFSLSQDIKSVIDLFKLELMGHHRFKLNLAHPGHFYDFRIIHRATS